MCDSSGVSMECCRWSLTTLHSDWSEFKMSLHPLWALEIVQLTMLPSFFAKVHAVSLDACVAYCSAKTQVDPYIGAYIEPYVELFFNIACFLLLHNFSCLSFPKFSSPPQLAKLPGSVQFSSVFPVIWKLPPGRMPGQSEGLSYLFLFSRRSESCAVYCPKQVFHIFCLVF